jgi:flagellar basal-body rod protein FlgF
MNYGMYRSAAGVMSATYRTGVIANNLANAETIGFKRDLALIQQRRTGAQEMPGKASWSSGLLDKIGGGLLASPTLTDHTQGGVEPTGRPLDAAIVGEGFFQVELDGQRYLTRNGNFMLDHRGRLILADGSNARVLSQDGAAITLDPLAPTEISQQGQILQRGAAVALLGVKTADHGSLRKVGRQLLEITGDAEVADLRDPVVRGAALERSNVDPSQELTRLLEAQRQLEANASLIRYQDATLGRLVNDIGKIS